jgi:EAL domain-containing protein (putative c-di-GMP-specific phosphodiesterase class I)/putative methionine-R-sulfoxide reductase with GAF domain
MERTGLEEAIRRAAHPVVLMQRVADAAVTLLEGADGVLVGLNNDPEWLTLECCSGYLEEQIGCRIPLDGSLVGLAFRTGETLRCDDVERDSRVELDICRAFHVASSVCVPLRRGKETVGVFGVTSSRKQAFDDRDVATLTSLARFISVVIAAAVDLAAVTDSLLSDTWQGVADVSSRRNDRKAEERFVADVLTPGASGRLESRGRIDALLEGRGLNHLFQPVFDLTTGDCFAVEALARFSGRPCRTPDLWFAEAHSMGVGVELEVASVKKALAAMSRLPAGIAMCVNAGPEALGCDEVRQLLAVCEAKRVVMELTEQVKVEDYPRLSHALKQLSMMGVRLAIDDTGAGFSSLAHILKLTPDLIKLDRELTCGIEHDPVRGALAAALVSFASGIGAEIIAEGIETAAELEVLRGLGIRYGQGYLLCRPTAVDSIPSRLSVGLLPAFAA